jgi:hypothetical protein
MFSIPNRQGSMFYYPSYAEGQAQDMESFDHNANKQA